MPNIPEMVGSPRPGAVSPQVAPATEGDVVRFDVPTAPCRPGKTVRLEPFREQPGDLSRPDPLASFEPFREHAQKLVRVLDDDQQAAGAWQPELSPQLLRSGLEMMLRSRHMDARLTAMQRQGRLSFYVSSTGEEASAVAAAMAFSHRDLLFPTYRQPGLMMVRGMPMLAMMCQCLGNKFDNAKGRQMPAHYSWKSGNTVSVSSPVGTQFPQAVGAAMAFAYRGEAHVVSAWMGEGTSSQGDFHYALNFASVYKPPCLLQVVNNQWAISTHCNLATGGRSFAARAEAYGLPGLRVDGNDFLAVYAATAWAIERARRGGGATLIEMVTYRCGAHSTSDDASQYRADEEEAAWPGGDPIDRLKRHLIYLGQWSDEAHHDLNAALEGEAAATFKYAEAYGSLSEGSKHDAENMFEDVYQEIPAHLQLQLQELQDEENRIAAEKITGPRFDSRRAAG